MIRDLDEIRATEAAADVCVVGAGAAGLTLATTLSRAGATVVLLEAGGPPRVPPLPPRHAYERTGCVPRYQPYNALARVFGGTTALWGGHCTPLTPLDFERRSWIAGSGWPFSYADLYPLYRAAQEMCGAAPAVYGPALDEHDPALHGGDVPAWDPELLLPWYWQIAPRTDFGRRYRDTVDRDPRVQALLHARVTQLAISTARDRIDHVDVRGPRGTAVRMRAKAYVLCCGGIENARLLLAAREANRPRHPGLGAVGRHFTDHLHLLVADVRERASGGPLSSLYGNRRTSRPPGGAPIPFFSGLALSGAAMRAEGTLNACATLERDEEGNLRLMARCEQLPLGLSRVTLSPRVDAHGERLASVDWRIGELERHTLRTLARVVSAECERLGIASVSADPWLEDGGWEGRMVVGTHHCGTTRMSRDPRTGVVDADCRAHGIGNLYLAGSSVFPSSGFANPTLTIVALALRLAKHLAATLR